MNDLRFAFRQLARAPGFTAVAALTLALGIGATTAITSVVRTVLLDPIAAPAPGRLVRVLAVHKTQGWTTVGINPPALAELREHTNLFRRLAVYEQDTLTRNGAVFPEPLSGLRVTPEFFRLWSSPPELGRAFADDERRPGHDQVIVLSHKAWVNQFGADPAILGRALAFKEGSFTVVGIMPPHFQFLPGAAYWRPYAGPEIRTPPPGVPAGWSGEYLPNTGVIAELDAPDARPRLEALLGVIARRQQAVAPQFNEFDLQTRPLRDMFLSPEAGRVLWALFGGVALVLAIACANVANLQIARLASRQSELAVRVALGAGRRRLFRQLLAESLILAVIGGLAGLVLAGWGMQFLEGRLPAYLPRTKPIQLDLGALNLSLLVSLGAGLLFGLVPAAGAARLSVADALKLSTVTTTRARSGAWLSRGLVVAQVALAALLLAGAGLMVRSVQNALAVRPGFDPRGLHYVYPGYDLNRFLQGGDMEAATEGVDALFSEMARRAARIPGVTAAGLAMEGGPLALAASPTAPPADLTQFFTGCGPEDGLRAIGASLREGRWLEESDGLVQPRRVLLNEAAARRLFPGGAAVGRQIWDVKAKPATPYEVAGVVRDLHEDRLAAQPPAMVYRTIRHTAVLGPARFLVVHATGGAAGFERALGSELKAAGADVSPPMVVGIEARMQEALAPNRAFMGCLLAFATAGLLLAALGLYGVLAFNVARRTREIGVRMALGAARREVTRLILRQGLLLALLGVCGGMLGALAGTRALRSFLFGVTPGDPATLAAVSLLLLAVAAFASWLPARRAAQVDPMVALRAE